MVPSVHNGTSAAATLQIVCVIDARVIDQSKANR